MGPIPIMGGCTHCVACHLLQHQMQRRKHHSSLYSHGQPPCVILCFRTLSAACLQSGESRCASRSSALKAFHKGSLALTCATRGSSCSSSQMMWPQHQRHSTPVLHIRGIRTRAQDAGQGSADDAAAAKCTLPSCNQQLTASCHTQAGPSTVASCCAGRADTTCVQHPSRVTNPGTPGLPAGSRAAACQSPPSVPGRSLQSPHSAVFAAPGPPSACFWA